MNDLQKHGINHPPEQQGMRDKCFYSPGTFVEFPEEEIQTSIPARFEKMVRMYPDRLAVKDKDRSLTYGELNSAANEIAHAILEKRDRGTEPIALLFEHGIDMIPAIFGVLKAGKFYLGLDPSFPKDRNCRMLEDSGVGLILSNYRNLGLANDTVRNVMSVLNVDEIANSTPSKDPDLTITAEEIACLLYTSGSTGKPKGIVCPHRNIVFNGVVHGHVNRIRADDKLTLFHSIAFGSSHINLYQSLLNGASLHPFDIKLEGVSRIAPWLFEEQITVFHSTPLVFRQLAESLPDQLDLFALRLINLSGAPVSKSEIDLYKARFPATTVFEISIGSTETHTFSSFIVDRDFSLPDRGVPVGYPRPGREVLILDETGNVMEPGQVGEIAVRSRYLNLPFPCPTEITPNSKSVTGQLYLTGDLGRVMRDGFLIHVGRKDFVAKIRGFRVSVVEIELALIEHPGVMEAAVVPLDNVLGEKQLVAYVVPRKPSVLTVRDIANFLRTKLPAYMIPSTFVFLASLPQTNGKLDRRSLPRPERVRPNLGYTYVSATNATEQQLVAVWEEVLNIRPIGIHDNFFDLGGHSLAATRVVSQVIKQFQLELPLQCLFQSPTVAEMAAVITEHHAKQLSKEAMEHILGEIELMSEQEAQNLVAKYNCQV